MNLNEIILRTQKWNEEKNEGNPREFKNLENILKLNLNRWMASLTSVEIEIKWQAWHHTTTNFTYTDVVDVEIESDSTRVYQQ